MLAFAERLARPSASQWMDTALQRRRREQHLSTARQPLPSTSIGGSLSGRRVWAYEDAPPNLLFRPGMIIQLCSSTLTKNAHSTTDAVRESSFAALPPPAVSAVPGVSSLPSGPATTTAPTATFPPPSVINLGMPRTVQAPTLGLGGMGSMGGAMGTMGGFDLGAQGLMTLGGGGGGAPAMIGGGGGGLLAAGYGGGDLLAAGGALLKLAETPPPGCDPDAMKLFVGNIPKTCTEDQLLPLFQSVGKVRPCPLHSAWQMPWQSLSLYRGTCPYAAAAHQLCDVRGVGHRAPERLQRGLG